MKNLIKNIYDKAAALNEANIISLLETDHEARVLDVGCGDGSLTIKFREEIGCREIYGIDASKKGLEKSFKKGIRIKEVDINKNFRFINQFFDVVVANQVIEHVVNSDNFLSEIFRILRPNGYAVISTENGSSWCNIFASLMGWQIFSLTNISTKRLGIGNPLSLHKGKKVDTLMNHVRIYNFLGLRELLELHGFIIEKITGAGYFPFPASIGNLDKIHSHFITFKLRKNV